MPPLVAAVMTATALPLLMLLPLLASGAGAFSSFHGSGIGSRRPPSPPPQHRRRRRRRQPSNSGSASESGERSGGGGGGAYGSSRLVMRKQKASDRRTARLQRGDGGTDDDMSIGARSSSFAVPVASGGGGAIGILSSSVTTSSKWKRKKLSPTARGGAASAAIAGGGRGRARKRLKLYNSLSSYHGAFLDMISAEYRMEEAEVLTRLESSASDPFSLETSGHALFDLHPRRRGNIFREEVYRLEKSADATTTFFPATAGGESSGGSGVSPLPPNRRFSRNDVVVLTLQPRGTGDFMGVSSLPTAKGAQLVEARVLNSGPTYLDVATPPGGFEKAFGPASNDKDASRRGDPNLRVRADRFFSDVPYRRMVAALGQLTSSPPRRPEGGGGKQQPRQRGPPSPSEAPEGRAGGFRMDEVLREAILATYAANDPYNVASSSDSGGDFGELAKKLAKPPLPTSVQLADQVLSFIRKNPNRLFPTYNEPQLTAIRAALSRRLTLIQGPPGTGKTTVAGSIAFGFVHQCRNLSPYTKVLATAFSNVGADNMAEKFLGLGLKIVRVGKPSGVSESLWDHTLDAAVERDEGARKALEDAARATAKLRTRSGGGRGGGNGSGGGGEKVRKNKGAIAAERARRDEATAAVKASIQACNIAATKALREADVIVATSVGAADPQLLAACGIYLEENDGDGAKAAGGRKLREGGGQEDSGAFFGTYHELAPDNLPPLSLPFVIIDEACQSVEPATLIPVVSMDSCRSLVMLGDPCQLPPTVRTDASATGSESPLSVSLMARLASVLPSPVTVSAQKDKTPLERSFLDRRPTKQAVSTVNRGKSHGVSYRKQFSGSLLLSVQYRMHPSIAAFSSAVFYDGLLSSPLHLANLRRFPSEIARGYPASSGGDSDVSVRFVNVGGRNNEYRGGGDESGREPLPTANVLTASADPANNNSYRNRAEAEQILILLKRLMDRKETSGSSAPFAGSIGVVTPYSSQVALVKSTMASDQEFRVLAQAYPSEIEVKSVDAYQGRERDLIIFSAVRSNRAGRIGFLADWRRMNVALTRARSGLIVIGDCETLRAGDRHWEAFVDWCEGVGCAVVGGNEVLR